MKNLNNIAVDLFNKIRGRFPSVTIGDAEGNVTNVPKESRFYDFTFQTDNAKAGKVSISLDEDNGITVIVGKDIAENQPSSVQAKWFDFLRELRIFAKKRMLNFDVRDINKSNLQKRDYKFLAAKRPGETSMSESKMYGTNKTSYQRIGNARLAIKHSAPINLESASGRTQKIRAIYIESPEGERFKYPYRHLSGARAMARHVSEGGNAYDDFGKYISGLSEELNKLKKFSTYINRSGVMAETLGGYTDIVKERASSIRKEIQHLQKESFYKEAAANFTAPIVEEVPEDVAENWIDQLTIKQFNEELKDVFPYIYKLVGEATKAKELGPEDLVAEDSDPCWKNYKMVGTKKKGGKTVPNCVPESEDLEEGLRPGMDFDIESKDYKGFVLGSVDDSDDDRRSTWWAIYKDLGDGTYKEVSSVKDPKYNGKHSVSSFSSGVPYEAFKWTVDNFLAKAPEEAELEAGFDRMMGQFSNKPDDAMDVKISPQGMSKADLEPEKPKTPLGEFILSYFDRETGKFPKGETAVLTAVEKDYGDQYVEPARQFIEQVQATTLEFLQREASQSRYPETEMIKKLAGI
jgi:hypothetical protein